MDTRIIIAENICRLCKEKNISVKTLAEKIGKSSRQVSRYRNCQCNIPIDTLSKIAESLDVSTDILFSK